MLVHLNGACMHVPPTHIFGTESSASSARDKGPLRGPLNPRPKTCKPLIGRSCKAPQNDRLHEISFEFDNDYVSTLYDIETSVIIPLESPHNPAHVAHTD